MNPAVIILVVAGIALLVGLINSLARGKTVAAVIALLAGGGGLALLGNAISIAPASERDGSLQDLSEGIVAATELVIGVPLLIIGLVAVAVGAAGEAVGAAGDAGRPPEVIHCYVRRQSRDLGGWVRGPDFDHLNAAREWAQDWTQNHGAPVVEIYTVSPTGTKLVETIQSSAGRPRRNIETSK